MKKIIFFPEIVIKKDYTFSNLSLQQLHYFWIIIVYMRPNKKFLSVIIPLYNEEERINNLARIHQYLSSQKFDWEIILVNDGSLDNTKITINKMLKLPNFKHTRLISYSQNKGKGFAVKTGMLRAQGEYRLFADIDLSTQIEEFDKFPAYLEKSSVVIGSRRVGGSRVLIHQPSLREKTR